MAIFGYHLDPGRYEMAWVDSFHDITPEGQEAKAVETEYRRRR